MKHMTILVPEGKNNLSSIIGAYKIFSRANDIWKNKGKKEVFQIEVAGTSKKIDFYDGLFSVKPHTSIAAISKTNLIIIPSLNHHYEESVRLNKIMMEWIAKQYKQGAQVASICTGAFLLAGAGLLEGRSCSTHWSAAETLKLKFPNIHLQADKTITDENGIYTNGGAYSFLNLIIYLIEKYYDRPTAVLCAKIFQIEIDRHSQSAFAMFTGMKSHGDEVVKKAQSFLEDHYQEKISIEDLSSRFAVGRRHFDRRFIKATGNTPVEYTQKLKIESAKKAFENTRKSIHEVMYDVGYSDLKAFREVFRKITGMSPMDYRRKYNKEAVL